MSSPGLASSVALPMLALGLLSDKALENAVLVEVKGTRYEIPPNWTTAEATRVYNLEIPVAELKYVYMPLTQTEHLNVATPKLFSEAAGCRLQLGMDVGGDIVWAVNPAGIELFSTSSGSAFGCDKLKELKKRTSASLRTIAAKNGWEEARLAHGSPSRTLEPAARKLVARRLNVLACSAFGF